jgi:large subunit ribosomal protein L32
MPVPKKRHSNTRTRQRRANWKLKALAFGKCSQCGAPIMPHHACKNCGTYQGRQVLKIETEESKKPSTSQKGGKEKPKS